MITTVEISMYPLDEDFIPPIDAFIAALHENTSLRVTVGPTSTVMTGDHDLVMDTLRLAMAASHARFGKAVFVTKFIPGYEA